MYGKEGLKYCRTDQIMADAAYVMLSRDSRTRTGEFLCDEDALREEGITNFDQYLVSPGKESDQLHFILHHKRVESSITSP